MFLNFEFKNLVLFIFVSKKIIFINSLFLKIEPEKFAKDTVEFENIKLLELIRIINNLLLEIIRN